MERDEIEKPSGLWSFLPDSVTCVLDEVARSKIYPKTTVLYQMGEEPKGLFFVYSGLVGLFNTTPEGKEHLFRLFGKGLCLGHRSLLADEPYHARATVLEESRIGFVDRETVFKLLEEHSDFARQMLKKLAKELRVAELRLAGSTDKQVAERVAEAMIYLKDSFPDYQWTRKEIAYYCGSTAPTVIRVLAQFEKWGLLSQKGREIAILNREGLRKFANLE